MAPPPSSNRDEFYESVYACDLSMHQKYSNYILINLLFDFCKFILIIGSLNIHLNPHLGTSTNLFYFQNATS